MRVRESENAVLYTTTKSASQLLLPGPLSLTIQLMLFELANPALSAFASDDVVDGAGARVGYI